MISSKSQELLIRLLKEEEEERLLSPYACKARNSRGRNHSEPECSIRTCFERDRDRIVHSKAFRRLKHKTQVFLAPKGDHFRTRLTHTLETAQIARTIARCLRLNVDLTEAIALGHDLGHTPFGHAGEEVLNELLPGGFRHYEQSERVVELLERDGKGLNLTVEVKDGILSHSKGKGPIFNFSRKPLTLEAEVVRISDIIAYVNHDIDDAVRAGIISETDIPSNVKKELGETHSQRIDTLVKSVISLTLEAGGGEIQMEDKKLVALLTLRDFLFERVYLAKEVKKELEKAKSILYNLFEYYLTHFEEIDYLVKMQEVLPGESRERLVADYVSGMTDRFALYQYQEFFLPKPWV